MNMNIHRLLIYILKYHKISLPSVCHLHSVLNDERDRDRKGAEGWLKFASIMRRSEQFLIYLVPRCLGVILWFTL